MNIPIDTMHVGVALPETGSEVETLLGDATKAREQVGWTPKITFEEMVQEMMQTDLELAQRDDLVEREGYKAFKYFE